MNPILEIKNVHRSFRVGFWMRSVEIIRNISFTVPQGSVFGFLGANGAGKTTLINMITGLKAPTQGEIKIAGHLASTPEARAKLGFLPERPYFYDHLNGEGILTYFGLLSGMSKRRIQERIPIVLNQVGMSAARLVELKKYSKGMLQRIGIAQALIHDPEFLVLDEPMSGLDPMGRKEMRELILKLSAEGKTIFFSTHVIPDAEAICDQVGIIRKGELLGHGSLNDLLSKGPSKYEVYFSGVSLEKFKGTSDFSSLDQIPEGLKGVIENEKDVDQVLRKILNLDGHILSVSPIRPTLESLFDQEAERKGLQLAGGLE